MTTRHARSDLAARRPDESMTLLNEVYSSSLDEGYVLVAQRRTTGLAAAPRATSRVLTALVAATVGLALCAAALALHQPTASAQKAREVLESRIVERNDEVAALQGEIEDLDAQITSLQSALAGAASARLDPGPAVTVAAGQAAVSGPGLRVELSDAQGSDPDAPDDDSRVQDVDLQVVVNGLWQAGAEAVAVNGQRITSTTAIRSAGSAVLVDLVPLSGPYRVEAVGNAVALQTGLARSTAGELLTALRSTYGIGVDISRQDALDVPRAAPVTLRYARVPDDALPPALQPTPAPTPTPTYPPSSAAADGARAPARLVSTSRTRVAMSAAQAADTPHSSPSGPGEDRS